MEIVPPKIQERSESETTKQKQKQSLSLSDPNDTAALISLLPSEHSKNGSPSLPLSSPPPDSSLPPLSLPFPAVELATLRPVAVSARDASIYHFAVINAYFAEVC